MKIKENQEKSDFNRKSLTSIPFGGPIVQNPSLLSPLGSLLVNGKGSKGPGCQGTERATQ